MKTFVRNDSLKKAPLEELFVHFRTSGVFIWSVVLVIAVWVGWNLFPGLPHFDDTHFGHLNLLLSMEATIATVLLMRDNERSRVREMNLLRAMHAQIVTLAQIERDIDEIQEDIDEISEEAAVE